MISVLIIDLIRTLISLQPRPVAPIALALLPTAPIPLGIRGRGRAAPPAAIDHPEPGVGALDEPTIDQGRRKTPTAPTPARRELDRSRAGRALKEAAFIVFRTPGPQAGCAANGAMEIFEQGRQLQKALIS